MNNNLTGLSFVVVGAGPAGLTFARKAHSNGANVIILEKAGDPRGDDAGYTDRSFNLTLNQVGRRVLGDERAWAGSTRLVGRAVHSKDSDVVRLADFGGEDATILTSVPRPTLRKNMVNLTEEEGVEILFRTNVTNVDPDSGEVTVETAEGESKHFAADLVILADGIHSLADKVVEEDFHGSLNMRTEPLNYLMVMLSKETAKDMSLHHIHFWHEPESNAVAIGIPNEDGTIAVLLASRFEGLPEGDSPFPSREVASEILKRDFPQILSLEPNLADQVVGRKRGRFHYKSITNYILGDKCVVVGDASSASPPWAGFGANTAIYSADVLVRYLIGCPGDMAQALQGYQEHKKILAEMVLDYAGQHGEFLNKKVSNNPQERPIGPVLGELVDIAVHKTNAPGGVQLLTF